MSNECNQIHRDLEATPPAGGGAVLIERHLRACTDCAEYAALRQWSRQVLQAGQVEVAAPLMSAVWASIHRASEQAWDSALTRSFRYLLPYMVAVVALILLVGGLFSNRTPAPAPVGSAVFSALNSPETPAVANVMTMANLPSQDPADILAGPRH
ncbi:MAG TPA: hypothetical protein VN515_02535 [Terriglobales bacterium]|nr:hypothetical protein [Terriglobales bacterium]